MLTKARIAGHPIHPMLVAFPVAFYVATVVSLFVFVGNGDVFWFNIALVANIAGVVMAAVAAIPGLIDLVTLPSDLKSARATGIRHAGFNVIALMLFAASAISLYRDTVFDVTAPVILGILGLVSTTIAGWLGYTMVQVHHLGVLTAADLESDVHTSSRSSVRIPVRRGLTDRSLRH